MQDLNTLTAAPGKTFTPDLFDQVPTPLADGLKVLTDETEKAVFLMGSLGVISGLLPNVQGTYDGQLVYPNLFVYVLGPYGSGKGGLRFARELGMPVHKAKLKATKDAQEQYEVEQEQYEADYKDYKKGRLSEAPIKPTAPPQQLSFIPANNSKTGLFELLNGNNGAGTLFETEGDTLTDAIRQDYGNFSDGLRKGFHHEPISFYRRLNREFVEIENPCLSVILSSTFDQLLALIPTAENGLFSRFCYFNLPPDPGFKNVFDDSKDQYQQTFRDLGQRVFMIWERLNQLNDPINYTLTPDQQTVFLRHFQNVKKQIQADLDNDLDGAVNRLGLIFYRISMILSVLRDIEAGSLGPDLVCSDSDFELTRSIVEVLKTHALDVYTRLPQAQQYDNSFIEKADQVKRAIDMHRAGKTYGAISKAILGTETLKGTIYRWINYHK